MRAVAPRFRCGRRARLWAGAAAITLAVAACSAARADETDYEVRVASDVTIDLGANGAISVALVPANGRTISVR